MMYREKSHFTEENFRKKLKAGLLWCTLLFLMSAAMLVVEVFLLMSLEFCDGEDLMSLYWSTWVMLQLGSEIAILGIVLALWHQVYNVRLPMWALALGTPVLVVAGFGHVIHVALRMCYKRAKTARQERKASAANSENVTVAGSSASSIKPMQEEVEQREQQPEKREQLFTREPSPSVLEAGQALYFALDVGNDERVKQWPSFVGMANGKAIVELTAYYSREASPGQ